MLRVRVGFTVADAQQRVPTRLGRGPSDLGWLVKSETAPRRLPSATTPPEGILGETGLLDAATKAELDQQFRAVQVLYFAMLASLVGYLVIGLVLGSGRMPNTASSAQWVRIFYVLGTGLIVAAYLVKKRMVRPLSPGMSPAEIKQCLASFRSGHLVTYVLCEGIGLAGLLGLFLGGSRPQFINLIVVAFALMILLRPKRIDSSTS